MDIETLDPSLVNALQPFQYQHLPERLQRISKPFCALAADLVVTVPHGPELTHALIQLRRAKDHAITACTAKQGAEALDVVRNVLGGRPATGTRSAQGSG